MSQRLAWWLLLVQVLLLLAGTQMPGAWRAGIEGSLHLPWGVSSAAHLVLFASMAWVASALLAWAPPRVLMATIVLAILTEGLQFWAIDRHPGLLDMGIDLAGAGLGIGLAWGTAHWVRLSDRRDADGGG